MWVQAGKAFLCVCAFLCGVTIATASPIDDFWDKKPSEKWTIKEALQVVRDSPWAQENTIWIPRPGVKHIFASPATGNYLIRWESADPVIQAFARLSELNAQATMQYHSPPPRLPSDFYVITVKATVPPRRIRSILSGSHLTDIRKGATLKTKQGTFFPTVVERSGQGKSTAVHFFFARTHEGRSILSEKGETVVFRFAQKGARLKCKFKLKPQRLSP